MDKFNKWLDTPIVVTRGERLLETVALMVLTAMIIFTIVKNTQM